MQATLVALGVFPALRAAPPETRRPPTLILHIMLDWTKSPFVEPLMDLAAAMGYDAVMLELGGNVALKAQGNAAADWSPGEIRRLVAHARRRRLEVIPCTSLLGHPECAPRNPRYVDPEMGWRLWEPGAYEFMSAVVKEICDLFDHPRYFHARCDEAGAAIAANSQKLNLPGADFLSRHITRLRDICRHNGARLVIWHDMLASPGHIPFANSNGGPPVDCWRAIETIPTDVIVNFWLYDFEPRHATGLEFFLNRGFEVWLSPWLYPAPMCQWAASRGLPILETCWIDPSWIPFCEWQLRAIVTAADARTRRNQPPPDGAKDATVRALQVVMTAPSAHGELVQVPMPDSQYAIPPGAASFKALLDSLPARLRIGRSKLNIKQPLLICQPQRSLDDAIASAEKPLRVVRTDGASRIIDGVNRARGEGELILYTESFGPRTRTNIYGAECALVGPVVQEAPPEAYGIGDTRIPPGGYVLSAHCGAGSEVPKFLLGVGLWRSVRIIDATGRDLLGGMADDTATQTVATLSVSPTRPARAIWLIHCTNKAMPITCDDERQRLPKLPMVGRIAAKTRTGEVVFPLRWGQHLASWGTPRWLVDALGRPERNAWIAWAADRPDGGIACLWATRLL
ncbi:MAG: family 20 glycosylhydrolase, partial [Armatimonadetes bacterium]|nr:family 20 glycosylhydrolase [Armatimonadota bacterium]